MEFVMSYNLKLETKIDVAVKRWKSVEKKKMFGGVCYLIKGNMSFGIWKDSLIVRMEKESAGKSLAIRNVGPFAVTGKPMAGWILVAEAGWKGPAALEKWINIGKKFALSLPEKKLKIRTTKTLREYKINIR